MTDHLDPQAPAVAVGLGVLSVVALLERGGLTSSVILLAIVASYVVVGARTYLALRG
ncbi:hypothetical protein J4G33_06015 [Actinotalea sp. BY-33]|uniref:Uncharacterized protein n=1 Tax=Actinotalea soli TaxID=2819234 RepID=A0A939LSM2_9CELL|nr:hypothetical protein [Actinotalea soli]MBO1751354.1 hypothetical protein [Actinotalea soli]